MKAISFFSSNLNQAIVQYQKKVFDHFSIDLLQIQAEINNAVDHGRAIDKWLSENEWSEIAIFDVDCIPLHKFVVSDAKLVMTGDSIYGAAQKANHIPGSPVYVSPAFCCFTKDLWRRVGVSFAPTQGHDTGSLFTDAARIIGAKIQLLWPLTVENPAWDLDNGKKFGHGTNYQDIVYHAFESRMNHESTSRFILKCKEVIGE